MLLVNNRLTRFRISKKNEDFSGTGVFTWFARELKHRIYRAKTVISRSGIDQTVLYREHDQVGCVLCTRFLKKPAAVTVDGPVAQTQQLCNFGI
jgi:hypothetical protein